jgi:putative transposase
MAGQDRMTIEEVVRKVLRDEHADVIRESVRAVAQEMMEAEVTDLVGAKLGERTEDRATHRNGYRPRRWDTRAGEIELQIPKLRQGSYFPSFLTPRKRSEQALVAVVQQAYVCGVSTWSATIRFNCAFSASSSFKRLTSSAFIPPNWLRHR